MVTQEQEAWADLLNFLLDGDYQLEILWFVDLDGREIVMANRICSIEQIPQNAMAIRIDGTVWSRPEDSFRQNIKNIGADLKSNPKFQVIHRNGSLFIHLNPDL